MARIATGSIVADISGKVGDNVYSRNKGGLYVKQSYSPVQPGTTFQVTALGYFADANSAWANLTDEEFTTWEAFTKNFIKSTFNGSQRKWTPKGLFIHCFVNRKFIGISTNPEPVMPGNSGFQSLTITQPDSTTLFFKVFGGSFTDDFRTIYLSTISKAIAVRSLNSVQQASFFFTGYQPNVNVSLFGQWTSRFDPLLPDASQRLFGSVKIIHKLSGIQVGFGWNSTVGTGVGPPATIGNTSIGSFSAASQRPWAIPVIPGITAQADSISFYHSANFGNIQYGIYSDNAGEPDVQLAVTAIFASNGSLGWQTQNLLTPLELTADTTYWIAKDNLEPVEFFYETVVDSVAFGASSPTLLQDPYGFQGLADFNLSIYANLSYP